MKTIRMLRDFDADLRQIGIRAIITFRAGTVYVRVPEIQARIILAAGAGEVVLEEQTNGHDTSAAT